MNITIDELAALIELALRGPHTAAENLFIKACTEKINAGLAAEKQKAEAEQSLNDALARESEAAVKFGAMPV